MRNKLVKRILTAGLVAVMAVTMIAGCGSKGDGGSSGGKGKDANFTWWIYKTDGEGSIMRNMRIVRWYSTSMLSTGMWKTAASEQKKTDIS